MNETFIESTDQPWTIYFKITLDQDGAWQSAAEAFLATLSTPHQKAFGLLLELSILERLREKSIVAKAPASARNNFTFNADHTHIIICHNSETIGLLFVTDWQEGVAVVRDELEKIGLLKFSEIGWRDPGELQIQITHPRPRSEPIEPILNTVRTWLEEKLNPPPIPPRP